MSLTRFAYNKSFFLKTPTEKLLRSLAPEPKAAWCVISDPAYKSSARSSKPEASTGQKLSARDILTRYPAGAHVLARPVTASPRRCSSQSTLKRDCQGRAGGLGAMDIVPTNVAARAISVQPPHRRPFAAGGLPFGPEVQGVLEITNTQRVEDLSPRWRPEHGSTSEKFEKNIERGRTAQRIAQSGGPWVGAGYLFVLKFFAIAYFLVQLLINRSCPLGDKVASTRLSGL